MSDEFFNQSFFKLVFLVFMLVIAVMIIWAFANCIVVCWRERHEVRPQVITYADIVQVLVAESECMSHDSLMFRHYRSAIEHLAEIVRCTENENGRLPQIVEKKVLLDYFGDIVSGNKKFEIRRDKDNICAGDIMVLREIDNEGGYTGNVVVKKVKYVLRDCAKYGLKRGHCIISF